MANSTFFEHLAEFHEQVKAKCITLENFQAFLRNHNQCFEGQFPSLIPEYTDRNGNKRKWEDIFEDVAPSQFDISKLKPRSFIKSSDKKGHISGEEMRKLAVEFKGNLGLVDGTRMFVEQHNIPVEFRDFYIPFPGTVLRDPFGSLRVPYLYWNGGWWVLRFAWLGDDWDDDARFACSE